ncbi:uncharacterized protein BXZ73DRAFT_76278 [Epithele typhae]|uniref:uncharacterized protein n=1 Tax=Epithele typhae TaxID=378194 RepID=UPI0020080397|nr:uncharacterized protein BXZ73DRAFT_76278 [Epithele typhae]KAH9938764.1 hypothetical protein BXZ73DRAFT_76278 [Epithele typhae]
MSKRRAQCSVSRVVWQLKRGLAVVDVDEDVHPMWARLRCAALLLHDGPHNLLVRHANGCTSENLPLRFKDVVVELRDTDFNAGFRLRDCLPRLEWPALVDAARKLGDTPLPAEQLEMADDGFLKKAHHVLIEVRPDPPVVLHAHAHPYVPWAPQIHVEEGATGCSHVHPFANGVPNMLLAEHDTG